MTRREIKTSQASIACDVCGRTLLRGEQPESFLAGGERKQVCDLCTARAAHEGWIRESTAAAGLPARREAGGGRNGFLGLLRSRRPRRGDLERPLAGDAYADEAPSWDDDPYAAEAAAQHEPESTPAPEPAGRPYERAPASPQNGKPAVPRAPRERRQVHAIPTNDDLKRSRAAELFNTSTHTRKVSGVARSLGAPWVSINPSGDEPSVVTIVVGWELSWYRFIVDLADEDGGVRVTEQGAELAELPDREREWNAAADETGRLALDA
jgi:hypothetical protein